MMHYRQIMQLGHELLGKAVAALAQAASSVA